MRHKLEIELDEAEQKAIESLSKYKFVMFGYWAGIWVHLNRLSETRRPNPFRQLVSTARQMKEKTQPIEEPSHQQ